MPFEYGEKKTTIWFALLEISRQYVFEACAGYFFRSNAGASQFIPLYPNSPTRKTLISEHLNQIPLSVPVARPSSWPVIGLQYGMLS